MKIILKNYPNNIKIIKGQVYPELHKTRFHTYNLKSPLPSKRPFQMCKAATLRIRNKTQPACIQKIMIYCPTKDRKNCI